MELIEVCDQSFLPVGTAVGGQNFILQGFNPAQQFLNDGGSGGAFELIEEFPMGGVDAQASYVQVMEPSPTVVVNYILGANGSLIPVYESLPIDNTVTIVTGIPEPVSEPTVPPHVLDHMYAKKPKEPGTETPTKPRKRVKKKEHPPRIVTDYVLPEIISPNTTKVNIIRKGSTVSTPQQVTYRPLISSRPKILQNTKSIATSPQRSGPSLTYDLSSSSFISNRTSSAIAPTTITSTIINERRHLSSTKSKPPATFTHTQPPSIYFLPSKANPSDVSEIIGSGVESTKTSFIVTSTGDIGENSVKTPAEQMCLVLPSSSANSRNPLPKTEVESHLDSDASGHVRTFQLNSDGTLSAVQSMGDETVMAYSSTGNTQQEDHHQSEMYSEFSIESFPDDGVGSAVGEVVGEEEERTTGGSFQLGDKQIFFSYE